MALQGVLFALRHHGRALIADEMGVGKTVQAIALMACYPVSASSMGLLYVHLLPYLTVVPAWDMVGPLQLGLHTGGTVAWGCLGATD